MNYLEKIVGDIEEHNVTGIKECFANGINPNDRYNNEPLIYELTSEYLRSARFKTCVQAFVDNGLNFEDTLLLSVLLDDAALLDDQLKNNPAGIAKRYSLRCAFTPFFDVTLLHICAEFNHLSCAEILVKYGADINATAGKDVHGFGGQTPVFHTVNQIHDNSRQMLHYLLSLHVDLEITVRGLTWGKSYPWETLVPAINPVSYAMMGLLPQMHRPEKTVAETVSLLLNAAYGIDYTLPNIPNRYLKS